MCSLFCYVLILDARPRSYSNDISKLLDSLNQFKDEITGSLGKFKDEITGSLAKLVAATWTVSIFAGEDVYAHGMIVRKDNSYFLLSAAHVVISLTQKNKLNFKFSHLEKVVFTIVGDCLFIPKNYVTSGENDIGYVQIEFALPNNCVVSMDFVIPAPTADLIGATLIGRSESVYFNGSANHINQHSRMVVSTLTSPGCSGTPLFISNGRLAGFVHGSSRHRKHNMLSLEDISAVLYADSPNDIKFYKFPKNTFKMLSVCEDIPESMRNDDQKYDDSHVFVIKNIMDCMPSEVINDDSQKKSVDNDNRFPSNYVELMNLANEQFINSVFKTVPEELLPLKCVTITTKADS
jgi:hypothetical protein